MVAALAVWWRFVVNEPMGIGGLAAIVLVPFSSGGAQYIAVVSLAAWALVVMSATFLLASIFTQGFVTERAVEGVSGLADL